MQIFPIRPATLSSVRERMKDKDAPLGRKISYFVLAFVLLVALFLIAAAFVIPDRTASVIALLSGIFVLLTLILPPLLLWRRVRFEVSQEGLQIRGDMYGRFIPRSDLRIAEAKIFPLAAAPEYQPALRTNGIGAPGYNSGWHRLRNRKKALLFVTDVSHLVYLPTNKDYSILLSPTEPEAFLAALQSDA